MVINPTGVSLFLIIRANVLDIIVGGGI